MFKVKNKKVIRRIADKTRKAQKGRNTIAVLAIALTALMFTCVFTLGGSLIRKSQESTMRQVGGTAHAGYKYLTQEEYDILKQDKKIKEISYRIYVGSAINEVFMKLPTEVNYFEDLDAQFSFCYPQEGHMPQNEDEIVTSDLVLRALEIECELGAKVPLEISIGDRIEEKTFTLSGYYKGDPMMMAQQIAVSKEYQEKVASTPHNTAMEGNVSAEDYAGRIDADINFATSLMLERQVNALSRRCGFPEGENVGINWAYLGEGMDIASMGLAAVLLVIILLSGYLIIYNIFYINVFQDIAHYGLLKTIGTTGRQLRRIVRRQAYVLSLYGIPIGLVAGVAVGQLMLPMIMDHLTYAETTDNSIVINWWILAGSALFSFGTVYISCIKPCRIASRVTAIEAVRYTEGQTWNGRDGSRRKKKSQKDKRSGIEHMDDIGDVDGIENVNGIEKAAVNRVETVGMARQSAKRCKKEKTKRTRRVTPHAMAVQNVKRNRKKLVIVVISLSLALVLLNSIYSLLKGFDMDMYVANMTVSDFAVADASLDNFNVMYHNTEGVTKEFLYELEQQKGITEIGNIYMKENVQQFTDEDYALLEKRIFDNPDAQERLEMYSQGMEDDYLDSIREYRYVDGNIFGISKMTMEKLEDVEGELDWEKFGTGDYVITTRFETYEEGNGIDFFLPGEKVTLFNEKGEKRQYDVLAVASIPYACGTKSYGMFDCHYILPEEEFLGFIGEQQPMRTLFNVEKDEMAQMEEWISDYCQNVNNALGYTSKTTIIKEFSSYANMIVIVGDSMCFILACIGILNFVNTMVTSMLSRKQEFAMMEAVGMTGSQLKQMVCFEGGYYALLTGVISLVLGALLNFTVVRSLGQEYFFFVWKFTVLPVAVCIPVLMVIVLAVPVASYRRMCRISVVERMQRAE